MCDKYIKNTKASLDFLSTSFSVIIFLYLHLYNLTGICIALTTAMQGLLVLLFFFFKGYSHPTGTQWLINAQHGDLGSHFSTPKCKILMSPGNTLPLLLHRGLPKKDQLVSPCISCNLGPGMGGCTS